MKAIESGCRCIVYGAKNPANNGKEVVVGRFLGRHPEDDGTKTRWKKDWWEVDRPLTVGYVVGGLVVREEQQCVAMQSNLLRIDGNPDTVGTEEREKFFY